MRLLLALTLLAWLAPGPTPASAPDAALWQTLYTRAAPASGQTIDVRAVGDLMLGRGVARAANGDWDAVFAGVSARGATPLLGGDLTLGNLESQLARVMPTDRLQLIGPPDAAPALARAGFDALSLANNHTYDAGDVGLRQSSGALRAAGIAPLGVGEADKQPAIRRIGGLKVALLAASGVAGARDPAADATAIPRAGLDEALLAAVRLAAGRADVTVVVVHWGDEYAPTGSQMQRAWAERLVAAGADLIVGAHPHVVQPFAVVAAGGRSGLVLYSLGNFLFDQPGRWETSSGAVARVTLDAEGVVELAAAPVDTIGGRLAPLPPDSREGRQTLNALGASLPPGAVGAHHPTLLAWSWDGTTARALPVPRTANQIVWPQTLYVDLRGDGQPQLVRLHDDGTLLVYAGTAERGAPVWDSRVYGWPVRRIVAGDPNDDGRAELLMLLRKPDRDGVTRTHPFLLGERRGALKIVWGGSPRPTEILDAAVGDLDGDLRDELVFLEAGATPEALPTVAIFRWHSWFFVEQWRSPPGRYRAVATRDIDGDGRDDLLVDTVR